LSFYICLGICAVVYLALTILLIKYHRSRHQQSQPVKPHVLLETAWVLVPFILLVIMGTPATLMIFHINKISRSELTIKVTGFQWKWRYQYLDSGIDFFSNLSTPWDQMHGAAPKERWYLREVDHPVVVPIHTAIRFLVTSNDVIHSWWVPELGIKRDAIPGFIYESKAWIKKPGIYRGQCAELCGINHAFMPIVVEAVTQDQFEKWVAAQKSSAPATDPPVDGKALYLSQCSACHLADGAGRPPYIASLQGGRLVIGPVRAHIEIVLNGKQQTAMPAFAPQLNDEQIAAIINYERNSWGNNDRLKYGDQAGGFITAKDIADARKGPQTNMEEIAPNGGF
jgi:cytochrome c oxidase subunit 2